MQKNKKPNEISKNDEKIISLEEKITKLELEIKNKDEKIEKINNENNAINEQYKKDLINKSKEAQKLIDEKINNYKIRIDEETKNIKKYAIKNNAIELINIINQFSNVVNNPVSNDAIRNYVEGFKMFLSMYDNLLNSMGINEIIIKENDKFDETFMEAVDININPNTNENTIHKVVKKGYKLHEQILIYSQVIVYKKK